jgi:hypothetical protein
MSKAQADLLDELIGLDLTTRETILDADDNHAVDSFDKIEALFMKYFAATSYSPPPYPYPFVPVAAVSSDDEDPSYDPSERRKKPHELKPSGWDRKGSVGYATFDEALTTVEHAYRGVCACECGCTNVRKSGEEWEVVAPNTPFGKLYQRWASKNKTGNYFIVCKECAKNFKGDPAKGYGSHSHILKAPKVAP